MDAAYQKRKKGRKPVKPKRVAARAKGGHRNESRRLIQLLVSLALFLVVFLGRNAYSDRIDGWSTAISTDVDFQAAFQAFGQALADDTGVAAALKNLGLTMLGQEVAEVPVVTPPPERPLEVTPLIETGRFGLDQAAEYGVMKGLPKPSEPVAEPSPEPEPEPTPQIVTAMAQTHGQDGKALPSNVSFQYYELGLEKTIVPVAGTVTSGFGYRNSPITGKREFHLALDIAAREGTPIGAFADGVVRYIGENDTFGLYLMIDHANNVSTFYAHCSKLLVRKGESVTCGQTVALVGTTGNVTGAHLHLTILKDDIRLDPAYYVDL